MKRGYLVSRDTKKRHTQAVKFEQYVLQVINLAAVGFWWLHGGTGCSEKKAVSSPAVGSKPLTLRWLSTIVGPS